MENLIRLRQKEQDDAKTKAEAYTAAVNTGNAAYERKDYPTARNSYLEALKYMPGDLLATDQIKKIDYILAEAEKVKKAEVDKNAAYETLIASADKLFDAGSYPTAKDSYKKALAVLPTSAYAKQRIARIDEISKILSQAPAKTNTQSSTSTQKVLAAIPMGELNFKNESERQRYLEELIKKYPPGITLEKYKEQIKETYRYIIIRDNLAQEFRHVKYTTYSGAQYSMNGKPITQQYFLSQTKTRQGESYNEIDMQ
jgi:tetratricopeptide (TPR) repeat protein